VFSDDVNRVLVFSDSTTRFVTPSRYVINYAPSYFHYQWIFTCSGTFASRASRLELAIFIVEYVKLPKSNF